MIWCDVGVKVTKPHSSELVCRVPTSHATTGCGRRLAALAAACWVHAASGRVLPPLHRWQRGGELWRRPRARVASDPLNYSLCPLVTQTNAWTTACTIPERWECCGLCASHHALARRPGRLCLGHIVSATTELSPEFGLRVGPHTPEPPGSDTPLGASQVSAQADDDWHAECDAELVALARTSHAIGVRALGV